MSPLWKRMAGPMTRFMQLLLSRTAWSACSGNGMIFPGARSCRESANGMNSAMRLRSPFPISKNMLPSNVPKPMVVRSRVLNVEADEQIWNESYLHTWAIQGTFESCIYLRMVSTGPVLIRKLYMMPKGSHFQFIKDYGMHHSFRNHSLFQRLLWAVNPTQKRNFAIWGPLYARIYWQGVWSAEILYLGASKFMVRFMS